MADFAVPDDIVVTPEMIEAGADVIADHYGGCASASNAEYYGEMIVKIYVAMCREHPDANG
jgi:hypothetical protein